MLRCNQVVAVVILVLLALSACSRKNAVEPSEKRYATVVMQDGTRVSGAVVTSSPEEITLAGDDHITRTIAMKEVKSVEYGEAAAAQPGAPASAQPDVAASPGRPAPSPAGETRARPREAAVPTRTYELPASTEITVRSNETIDSASAAQGQSFSAVVSKDVLDASGAVAIPRGSNAQLMIVSASQGGRVQGASDLVLTLASVSVGGRRYEVDTSDIRQRGKQGLGANKRTAEYTGGAAAVGAIIGAIAGGGKGAAIGAGAGAGAGALTQILTKGKAVRVPAESLLTFKLDKQLRIVAVE